MKRLFLLVLVSLCLYSCKEEKATPVVERHNQELIPEIESLDKLLADDPDNHKLLFQRGQVYYNNEGYQEAVEDATKAINIDSSKIEYHYLLADAHFENFKSKKAVKALEDCLEIFPNSTRTQLKLSEYYLILKQYEKSIQLAGTLLEREPTNADAFFLMGMNYRAKDDLARAKNSFQATIENDPEQIDAWLILAELYEQDENPIALDYFNGALSADPNNTLAKHSKAFYLQNHGDIPGAQKLYDEIILSDRKYVQAPINSGLIYLESSNFEKARTLFNIVIENYPQNPLGHYYRGLANQGLGFEDAAKEDFQNSINIDPTNQRVRGALERISKAN